MMLSEPAMATARELAQSLYYAAISEAHGREWQEVVLDARHDGGGGFIRKVRIQLSDAPAANLCPKIGDEIDVSLLTLDKHRSDMGTEWFGLLYTVSSTGNVSIDLNYNSDTAEDAVFWES